jgi:hypothetical protein
MKILMSAALVIAGLAAAQWANAADLNLERPAYYSGERGRVYAGGPITIWRADQPADILYKYAPEYPGWRGDPYYANCRSVPVRQTLPDGTIVIRRGWAC